MDGVFEMMRFGKPLPRPLGRGLKLKWYCGFSRIAIEDGAKAQFIFFVFIPRPKGRGYNGSVG
jgi:hypothetical protein